jgi:hypothetical protein
MKASRIALAALALTATAAFAGTAEVRFVNPERFSDLGTFKSDEQANMDTLSFYIGQLAQQLPPDQVLRVDVLDVDLAGEPRQTRNGPLRIARDVSFPAMHMRWSLESNGRVLRTGDQRITDVFYRHRIREARYSTTSLFYEKRMLDDWFRGEFAPQTQAYAR